MLQTPAVLASLALECRTRDEWRNAALAVLERELGFDFGIWWTHGVDRATLTGFDAAYFARFQARAAQYSADVGALMSDALARGGAAVDTDSLSARRRDRSAFYREIIRPVGSRGFLTGVLSDRRDVVAALQLGRATRARRLRDGVEAEKLRALVPVLALGERAHSGPTPAALDLTSREQEIVRYVTLGFTNGEIALACGTSPNTVRNQLSSIFEKLEVTSRAELVARALGSRR